MQALNVKRIVLFGLGAHECYPERFASSLMRLHEVFKGKRPDRTRARPLGASQQGLSRSADCGLRLDLEQISSVHPVPPRRTLPQHQDIFRAAIDRQEARAALALEAHVRLTHDIVKRQAQLG